MSPEQARGKPVDKRSDIWAFGCVVYEMLTATRAFEGETISDTLAAILTREPDWSKLPASTPHNLTRLLRECLTRDSKQRLRDIGDARRTLDAPGIAAGVPAAQSPSRSVLPWAVAGALAFALVATIVKWSPWTPPPAPSPVQRHSVELGVDATLETDIGSAATLSPDGQTLAFAARPTGATSTLLYVRRLDQLQATALTGTDDARAPFFSPDGLWIAFFAEGKLKKVSVNGGAPMALTDAPAGRGGTWTESNSIIFIPQIGGGARFVRVSASGGRAEEFMEADIGASQRWPQILPGGNALLYSVTRPGRAPEMKVQTLPSGPRKSLGEGGFARYLPSGHLLFLQNGTLFTARFDLKTLSLSGATVPVIESVLNQANNAAQFAVADNGTLVYVSGKTLDIRAAMNWVDATGKTTPLRETRSAWTSPAFDPSGTRLAFTETSNSGTGLWVRDLARGVESRIAEAGDLLAPAWTADGQRIAFVANRDQTYRNLYWQRLDGVGGVQRLSTREMLQTSPAWHPDGRTLVFVGFAGVLSNLMVLRLEGSETSGWTPGAATALFDSPYQEESPTFSPDGKWIAYVANDTGTREVYVRPFPGPGGALLVSSGGGLDPSWSPVASQLFFQTLRRGTETTRIMVAPFTNRGEQLQFERPRPWGSGIELPYSLGRNFALHPDGKRFAVAAVTSTDQPPKVDKLVFVFNLFDQLRRLTK
jgi:serine/threonine-protein kinase